MRNNNKIIWLTGLPCSGKTTIAKGLAEKIVGEVLDGDDLRHLIKNNDFSVNGRKKHILSMAELAHRLSKYTNVIVSIVSPISEVRNEIIDKYNVSMIWVNASLEECERRDVKGMYTKARNREILDFTGIDSVYEEPNCNIKQSHYVYMVDTERFNQEECINFIKNEVIDKEYGKR